MEIFEIQKYSTSKLSLNWQMMEDQTYVFA
jgi:hypothetical protein